MKNNQSDRMSVVVAVFVAVLITALAVTSACSKKEPTPAKSATTASKAESEKKEERQTGEVELTPEGVKAAGIEVQQVTAASIPELIETTAVLELNADRISHVGPRVAGRCVTVSASQGDRVRVGQVLAQIDSVEMGQVWTDYLKAKGRLDLAMQNMKREETLFAKKVSPEKDLLKARQELGETEADILLAKEKFRILGVDPRQIEARTNGAAADHPLMPVTSPLSGVVIEKTVTQGETVGPDKTLFTIADLSTLWLMVDIYEQDLVRIKTGMPVNLLTAAYPGKEFRGKITSIADILDEKTRTAKARVTIDNRAGLLKPGMFATASIQSGRESRSGDMIVIPEESLFLDGSERYVFVDGGNGKFLVKRVSAGRVLGPKIEIKEGLKPGDRVVTKGVFTLKSELKKEMLEAE
jgi:cobalt-zinc-cadmium efflux system membrane fusion protein